MAGNGDNDKVKSIETIDNIGQDIEYICRLLVEMLKMPVYFLNPNNDISFSLSYGYKDNPLHPSLKELFTELFSEVECLNFPVVKATRYHENYFGVKLNKKDVFIGTFIVGPSTYATITAETIDLLIAKQQLSLSYKKQLINYYNSLTVLDYKGLVSASLLLHYSLYHKQLNLTEVMEKNSSLRKVSAKIEEDFQDNVSKNRQNVFFHHSPINERNISNCIKMGDKEMLLKYNEQPSDGESGILAKNNPLRARKNLAICGVTIATRAAMEGGLDSEVAYTLSDLYIQKIEETNELKDLSDLNLNMFCDFADRVKKAKEKQYSKVIKLCLRNILKHLYGNITLVALAEDVKVHPQYLSGLFKKEVGITMSEYIQREKINEAKRLLASSNYSLLDIATWLHFHDQSHFTRVFKRFEGITPKRYRDKNLIC